MLVKQVHKKRMVSFLIGISQISVLSFNQMTAIDVMIY